MQATAAAIADKSPSAAAQSQIEIRLTEPDVVSITAKLVTQRTAVFRAMISLRPKETPQAAGRRLSTAPVSHPTPLALYRLRLDFRQLQELSLQVNTSCVN